MVRVGSRLRLLYAVLVASVLSQAVWGWWTLRRCRRAQDRAVAVYEDAAALVAACKALPSLSSYSGSPVRSEALQGPSESAQSPIPPRVEGTGVSGRWRYADFRFPDGARRRYYLRRDADRAAVAHWLRTITLDALDHQPSVDEETWSGPEA